MRSATDERALLALLGVDEGAAWEDVRQAFRAAVRDSHPDLHAGDPGAESRLKALNAAWESVNTPTKWAAYTVRTAFANPPGHPAHPSRDSAVSTIARVRVTRLQQGSFGLLNWSLELDGEVIGSVENGGTNVFEAVPGEHSLRVFYGSRSSLPLDVELHRGQELLLGCRTPQSLRLSVFSPQRSLVLEHLGSRRILVDR